MRILSAAHSARIADASSSSLGELQPEHKTRFARLSATSISSVIFIVFMGKVDGRFLHPASRGDQPPQSVLSRKWWPVAIQIVSFDESPPQIATLGWGSRMAFTGRPLYVAAYGGKSCGRAGYKSRL